MDDDMADSNSIRGADDVVAWLVETPDAAFIAAANPTAILALLDERDALRAQVERVGLEVLAWEQLAATLCAPEDPDEEHLIVAEVLESRAYRIRAALDPQ